VKKHSVKDTRTKINLYFRSRKIEKKGSDGEVLVAKNGEVLYEEKPCTVTGLAFALGYNRREELEEVSDPKIKALIDRALLRIEESAEEKLFCKDTYNGAKIFLATNFKRWASGEENPEMQNPELGVCSVWAE